MAAFMGTSEMTSSPVIVVSIPMTLLCTQHLILE